MVAVTVPPTITFKRPWYPIYHVSEWLSIGICTYDATTKADEWITVDWIAFSCHLSRLSHPVFCLFLLLRSVAQLEARGILLLVCYLGLTVLIYLCGCAHHSHGHNHNWSRRTYYETIADATAAEKGDDDFSSTDENNADDVTLSMRPMLHPQIGVEAKENRRASFG